MRHLACLTALVLVCGCSASVPSARTPASRRVLPLTHVRLYETGLGYFERSGALGAGRLELPVPAAHVDDALMTLVVVGQEGTRVSSVEWDSMVSRGMARALAGLPKDSTQAVSYRELLESFEGVRVEVDSDGQTHRGRLLDVTDEAPSVLPVSANPADKDAPREPAKDVPWLIVVGDDSAVRHIEASHVRRVTPLDASVVARLNDAAGALSSRAARGQRALRVAAESGRPVTLGYVAEAPVWRASYRLVIDSQKRRGNLQAWALVHNDTDESWSHVALELLSGRPDSFLFPMAAPRYGRRDLVEPSDELSTLPQLADQTVDQMYGDRADAVGGVMTFGHGAGYGSASGHATRAPSVRMGAARVGVAVSESYTVSLGSLAAVAPAEGAEVAALFRYRLAEPLDLSAHASALVPFASALLDVRRITWFTSPTAEGRSAARIVNGTGQTLPAGPLALFEGGSFAGQAQLARMKPNERGFVEFGDDLDVELTLDGAESRDEPQGVTIKDEGSVIDVDFIRHHVRRYSIVNRAGAARDVALVLDVVDNSRVTGADELDYDPERRRALALFVSKPRERSSRTLNLDEALTRHEGQGSWTAKGLSELAAAPFVSGNLELALERAAKELEAGERASASKARAASDKEAVEEELGRLRTNLEALKSGDAARPLVARVLAAEDRRAALQKQIEGLAREEAARRDAARAALTPLAQRVTR